MSILAKLKKIIVKVKNELPEEFEITSDRRRIT